MKVFSKARSRKGFTLIELMVAMAVTTIIVSVLVSITSIALDTWTRSRSEVRAARQAKSMVDSMATDFESLVIRGGNNFEWLWAKYSTQGLGTETLTSSNASELIFYTAVPDRYAGDVTDENSLGDVSCVAYQLKYQDPIQGDVSGDAAALPTFVMYRSIVDPDNTFRDLLGSEYLERAFSRYMRDRSDVKNFLCENVYQFTMTFHVEVEMLVSNNEQVIRTGRVTLGESTSGVREFRVFGDYIEILGGTTSGRRPVAARPGSGPGGGLRTGGLQSGGLRTASGLGATSRRVGRSSGPRAIELTADDMSRGRVTAMEVSLTVLTDYAIDQMRNRTFRSEEAKSQFIAENSYQYSKLVELPRR